MVRNETNMSLNKPNSTINVVLLIADNKYNKNEK